MTSLPRSTSALRISFVGVALATVIAAGQVTTMPTAPKPTVIATVTTPETFFGFRMGTDRKMASPSWFPASTRTARSW